MRVPFLSLQPQQELIREELEKGFKKVLDGSQYILGKEVEAFEQAYAEYSGTRHCIAVANGMDALTISLSVLGIGSGDEVIVPALTCAPTWMAVARTGATIVAGDVDEKTFNVTVDTVAPLASRKTKAIVLVNLYGRPADLERIVDFASSKNFFVVEDNAQGHGAAISGKKTGSVGHINATSFYPTKNLGALGDGGAITTNDDELGQKARSFRNYGSTARFQHEVIGINSRLDELQAAFLRLKLRHLDIWNEERRTLAHKIQRELIGVGDLFFPEDASSVYSVYHLLVATTQKRDSLRSFLQQQEIETDIHYPLPPHLQKAFARMGYASGSFPVTEKICHQILSLPLWPGMGEEHTNYLVDQVKRFFKK